MNNFCKKISLFLIVAICFTVGSNKVDAISHVLKCNDDKKDCRQLYVYVYTTTTLYDGVYLQCDNFDTNESKKIILEDSNNVYRNGVLSKTISVKHLSLGQWGCTLYVKVKGSNKDNFEGNVYFTRKTDYSKKSSSSSGSNGTNVDVTSCRTDGKYNTPSSCNSFCEDGYTNLWDSTKNGGKGCCVRTYTKGKVCNTSKKTVAAKKTNTSKTSTSTTKVSTYTVLFDQNYGYGLECNRGTSYYKDGICYSNNKSGTTQAFPISSADNKMVRSGEGYLIGWTKDVSGNTPICSKKIINKGLDTSEINGDVTYYACYTENIGGYRFLQEGAEIDKPSGVSDLKCGDEFWIDYCTRTEIGGEICYGTREGVLRKIDRNLISESEEGASCSKTNSEAKYYYASTSSSDYACGEALYVNSCNNDTCTYNKILKFDGSEVSVDNKTVSKSNIVSTSDEAKKACKYVQNTTVDGKACKISDNQKYKDKKGSGNYSFCYEQGTDENTIKEKIANNYKCAKGYTFDMSSTVAVEEESDKTCIDGNCLITYEVNCSGGNNIKPVVSIISGIVQGDGYGEITVKARAIDGNIEKYYVSEEYLAPTSTSGGWKNVSGDTFTIRSTPGTKYIWVKDSKGNISNGASGSVIDTVNTDTTVKKLELYDENGKLQTPSKTAYDTNNIKSSKYVMMSNELKDDSKVLADAFNPFDTEYKLEVASPTISVYATLTSTDSKYIDGYEPRTVNLKYGMNTVLIKIQNNEGKVRTYTILVNRVDDRSSDNTLNEITVSSGKINFNSNTTEYKIEIPKETNKVDVKSTISSDLSSYVSGYEPGEVDTSLDVSVKIIKVMSQTGSVRTYVLTFVKEGSDYIEDETLQLKDLVIPNVYIPFESDVSNYSLNVDYQTDTIDLRYNLRDENSRVIISYKGKSDNEYKIGSDIGLPLEVGENFVEIKVINSEGLETYYRLTIIRKEFGLDISDDTTLKELKVLGYNIKFNPNKKDYTVKIKQEKSLVITAVPNSNRAEVFIRGNDELTGFSTVRVKVVAENGEFETYSIDIKKDAFNKTIEIASIIVGAVIIIVSSCIIVIKKKSRAKREYFEE